MPQQPGETLLLTFFCDVHYYFNAPGTQPQHDRFDRASYIYLYHNSIQRRGRIEVANHAGTPEQDAFAGYLDTVSLKNSHKQPNLFSLTVDALPQKPASPTGNAQAQWRIAAYDQKSEQKYLYRLHTLDVYFWTASDASTFLESIKRVLPAQLLQLEEAPSARPSSKEPQRTPFEHRDSMSPVVQQLEQAAITDPYRPQTTSSTQSGPGISTPSRSTGSPASSTAAAALSTPAPYNPAAPAAPEPIAHREKTPPPIEAAAGTGLGAAAVMEHPSHAQYASAPVIAQQATYVGTPSQNYFPGPPQSAGISSFPPPPPPSGLGSPGFAPPPGTSPHPHQQQYRQSSIGQPPAYSGYHQKQSSYVTSPGFNQHHPLQSPGMLPTYSQQNTPMQSPSFYPQHAMQSPGFPPPPPSGTLSSYASASHAGEFSNYTYAAQPTPANNNEGYAVHAQVYRPTEAEANSHGPGHGHAHAATPGKETRVDKLEKGVSKWLKRLDQRL